MRPARVASPNSIMDESPDGFTHVSALDALALAAATTATEAPLSITATSAFAAAPSHSTANSAQQQQGALARGSRSESGSTAVASAWSAFPVQGRQAQAQAQRARDMQVGSIAQRSLFPAAEPAQRDQPLGTAEHTLGPQQVLTLCCALLSCGFDDSLDDSSVESAHVAYVCTMACVQLVGSTGMPALHWLASPFPSSVSTSTHPCTSLTDRR